MSAHSFISHVDNNDLISLILESEQLREDLIPSNISSRKANSFLNMPLSILLLLSQVQQNELSIRSHPQHVRGHCYRGVHGVA